MSLGWLYWGFNSILTAMVISWRSVTHMYNFSFQSHQLLFSHASAEVRGKNMPERKVASTGDRTHNHQIMNPTRSPLSHLGGAHFSQYNSIMMAKMHILNISNQITLSIQSDPDLYSLYSPLPDNKILDWSKLK